MRDVESLDTRLELGSGVPCVCRVSALLVVLKVLQSCSVVVLQRVGSVPWFSGTCCPGAQNVCALLHCFGASVRKCLVPMCSSTLVLRVLMVDVLLITSGYLSVSVPKLGAEVFKVSSGHILTCSISVSKNTSICRCSSVLWCSVAC